MLNRLILAVQKFLLFKEIRVPFGLLRYGFYRHLARRFDVFEGHDEAHLGRETFRHNVRKIRYSIVTHDRVYHMLWPLLAIEDVSGNRQSMRTLSIGPRSEGELLLIAAHGFTWENIRGLDLFSYCPRIEVGDMHKMPFPANSFDIVFSGWSLGYSDDQERALKEIVRVLKPGGYVAFGQGYVSNPIHRKEKKWVGTADPHNKLDEIFAPISDHIDCFYFRHEITPEMAAGDNNAIIAVFSIKKEANQGE